MKYSSTLVIIMLFTFNASAFSIYDYLPSFKSIGDRSKAAMQVDYLKIVFDYVYAELEPDKKIQVEQTAKSAGHKLQEKANTRPDKPIVRVFYCATLSLAGQTAGICSEEPSLHYLPSIALLSSSNSDIDFTSILDLDFSNLGTPDGFVMTYTGPATSLRGSTFTPAEADPDADMLDQFSQRYRDQADAQRSIETLGTNSLTGGSPHPLWIFESAETATIQGRIVNGEYPQGF